jgi:hypothetical protein
MDSDRLNRWLSLGANIGVLVGIIFLAVEIRQNSDLARLQFADDRVVSFQQSEMALYGDRAADVWEKSVSDPASLTLAELRILDAQLAQHLMNSHRHFDLEQAGLLAEGSTKAYMQNELPFFFGTRFAKAWWKFEGSKWTPELFVQLADPIIRETGDNETPDRLLRIQREVTSEEGSSQ